MQVMPLRPTERVDLAARQTLDERVQQLLLNSSTDLWVSEQFRFGFSETTGLGMKASQARCVKTGRSQDPSERGRHQLYPGEGFAISGKMLRR